MKTTLIVIAVILLLFAALVVYNNSVVNPRVENELKTNPDGERAKIAMLLTFPDGRTIPVNYLEEDGKVFVGADGPWWRQFRGEGAAVTVEIKGKVIAGHAKVELNDQSYVDDIFSRLRPTAPAWLPDWLNGKLVIITPDE